jgi:parallel beta-helix repeat protein
MNKRSFYPPAFKLLSASLIIMLAFAGLPAMPANAAAITSAASGPWSAPTTWVGGVVPGSSDDVTIANDHTVAFDLPTATINSLTIQGGNKSGGLAISGNNALTVTTSVSIAASTASNITKSLSVGDGSLKVGTTLTITGGTSSTRKSQLTINTGTVTVTGSLSVPNARSWIVFSGAGILSLGGTIQSTGSLTPGTGTVKYTGAAQSVGTYTYNNLAFSGSGSKTISTGTVVNGNLSIAGTAKADIGAGLNIPVNTLALGGTGRVAGTWGSTSSAATNKNDTYFTLTTGMLTVATTLATTAPTVSSSSATLVKRTSAQFNGTVNANGDSTIVRFEFGTSTSYGSTLTAVQSPLTGTTSTSVSVQVPGLLAPGTTYHYRVVGVNSGGTAYGSDRSFTTSSAGSTTYYVDNTNLTTTCSDGGTGTLAAPFCTIGAAASTADAGDTVSVLAGTYAETVKPANNGGAGMPLTFSAASGVTVTGEAGNTTSGNAFRLNYKGYIVIDGFTVTGTPDHGIYAAVSNHITLSKNHVSHSGAASIYRTGIYLSGTTDSTITGNTTDHNVGDGIRLNKGSNNNWVEKNVSFGNAMGAVSEATGINLLANSSYNWIIRNITYANEDSGINFYTGSSNNYAINNLSYGNGDHGIDNNASPYNTLIGNTIHGNVTVGINFEQDLSGNGSYGATLMNNISVENGYRRLVGGGTLTTANPGNLRVDSQSTTGTTLDYDLIYSSTAGVTLITWGGTNYTSLTSFQATGQEAHGLLADPLFKASAPVAERPVAAPFNMAINEGDYHILTGSPAIDSANSAAPNEQTVDIEGNPRYDDLVTLDTGAGTRTYDDRGAYEYQLLLLGQTITVTAPDPFPTSAVYNTSFTTTATGGGSGNPVTILASGSCSGGGDNSALITMTSGTGDCTLTFNQAGNAEYAAAPVVTKIVTAEKAPQAITITAPVPFPTGALHDTSFTVTATGGGSGNPVTIAGSGSCTGTGDNGTALITMGSLPGDCTVTFDQIGNDNYSAATLSKIIAFLETIQVYLPLIFR